MAANRHRPQPRASPFSPSADHAWERLCYLKAWMLSWQDTAGSKALPHHIAILSGPGSHQELDGVSLNIQHPMKGQWETSTPAAAPVSGTHPRAVLLQQACCECC